MTKTYDVLAPKSIPDAVMAKLSAKRTRQQVKDNPHADALIDNRALDRADQMDVAADEVLSSHATPISGPGGEIIATEGVGASSMMALTKSPDMLNIEASMMRVELADQAGVFHEALDAAESVDAKDSLEKMLCHQLPALHRLSMEMVIKASTMTDPVEACRLANASARLMDTYQKGMVALKTYRRGGAQVVKHIHQYVQVQAGAQAVVTGGNDTYEGELPE